MNNFIINDAFGKSFDNITASELLRYVINYKFTVIGVIQDDVETVIGFANGTKIDDFENELSEYLENQPNAEFKQLKIIRNSTGTILTINMDK